jgi:hypothetical protein
MKADTTDTITVLQSKDYALFIFCGDAGKVLSVFDDEWKGR